MSAVDEPPSLQEAPEAIGDLPPSCKLVYLVLALHGELLQREVEAESRLPGRTVRYALERLQDEGCVESRPSTKDARCSLYAVRD